MSDQEKARWLVMLIMLMILHFAFLEYEIKKERENGSKFNTDNKATKKYK